MKTMKDSLKESRRRSRGGHHHQMEAQHMVPAEGAEEQKAQFVQSQALLQAILRGSQAHPDQLTTSELLRQHAVSS